MNKSAEIAVYSKWGMFDTQAPQSVTACLQDESKGSSSHYIFFILQSSFSPLDVSKCSNCSCNETDVH